MNYKFIFKDGRYFHLLHFGEYILVRGAFFKNQLKI